MMECVADERVWGKLRGSELSDYVGGPLETYGSSTFAFHLKSHGTQHDFATWIEKHPQPFVTACEIFLHAQDFAKVWLIDYLDNTVDGDVHHKVLTNLAHYAKFTHGVSQQASEVLDHINYKIITPSDRVSSFKVLLEGRQCDRIDQHWDVFKQTAQQMPPHFLSFAAFMRWDLHEKLNTTPVDLIQHFVACCVGGLTHRVKQYTLDPLEKIKIGEALVQTVVYNQDRPKIMAEILEYLFDAYPTQPWHNTLESLSTVVAYAPLPFAQKIITHFTQHAPNILKEQSEGLACHAIYKKAPKLLDALFPYIDPTDYHKVFQNALMNKRKSALKTLLHKCAQNTAGHEGFYKALEESSFKTQQWANEIYAEHQKEMLHSKLQTIRGGKSRSPGKKI